MSKSMVSPEFTLYAFRISDRLGGTFRYRSDCSKKVWTRFFPPGSDTSV
jgi:hypothetical protein